MKKSNTVTRWLWWFSLIVAAILVYKTTHNIGAFVGGIGDFIAIFTPFIIGFIITFLLYAPCNSLELWLKKSKKAFIRKIARLVSIVIVYTAFLALVSGLLTLLLPALYNAAVSLISNLPTYYEQASGFVASLSAEGGLLDRWNLVETMDTLYGEAYQWLISLLNTDTLLTAFKGILSVASSSLYVIMAIIVSIYMLAQREALLRAVKSVLGALMSDRALSACTLYAHKSAGIFYKYLYGALIDAVIVAVLLSVGFALFGLPSPVLIGCVIGIMNFIPYFGAIIGGIGAVIVALFSKNIYTAIGIAIYVIVVQQVDGNILQPRILGGTLGVRPIYVLLAITVGGGLFGFWGMLLSVPAMAILKLLIQDFIAYRNRKKQQLTETEE